MADQHPAITPTVFYRDPMAALKWLQEAFGFEIGMVVTDDKGQIGHAELTWRAAAIGIGGEWGSPEQLGTAELKSPLSLGGAGTQFIRVHLDEDIDAHCEHAKAAGARITQTPADQFYGARTYRALDIEGHVWTFQRPTAEVSIPQMQAATGLKIRHTL
jgi:uncharacterized glyoxalase superfamily protein PhnB